MADLAPRSGETDYVDDDRPSSVPDEATQGAKEISATHAIQGRVGESRVHFKFRVHL